MSRRSKGRNPSSELEQLERERDELREWFNKIKICCEQEAEIFDDDELPEPPCMNSSALIFNREQTELNLLQLAVDVVQEMSPDDERDVQVFANVWKSVLPWFSRGSITSEAESFLDTFMTRLYPLLDFPKIAKFMQEQFEQLFDLPYPDALMELCRNATFASKVQIEIVRRFVDALKKLQLATNGKGPTALAIDSKEKWNCVRLGNFTVDILQTTMLDDAGDNAAGGNRLKEELLNEVKAAHVDPHEMTISFYWKEVLLLLESSRKSRHKQS